MHDSQLPGVEAQDELISDESDSNVRHLCPSRKDVNSPVFLISETDEWYDRGGKKCCSFCGSLKVDEAQRLLERCLRGDEGYWVGLTTKSYKFYLRTPDDTYKFYMWHLHGYDKGVATKFIEQITEAGLKRQRVLAERFELKGDVNE